MDDGLKDAGGHLPRASAGLFDRPVIPVTLAFIAGIVLGDALPGATLIVAAIFIAAVIRLAVGLHRNRPAVWAPLLASASAGYLALMPWIAPWHGPDHVSRFLDKGRWQVRATVTDNPLVRLGRSRFIVNVNSLSRDGHEHGVNGRIRLTVMGDVTARPGDIVTFTARLRSFQNFRNPGGFDYRRHMTFQGVHGSAWAQADKLHIAPRYASMSPGRWLADARSALARMIDAAGDDDLGDEKAVLKALVFGDRSGIDDHLRQRFNRAGAGHLLAISGLHVGIVAALAFGLFRWIFSFSTFLLWRGWGRAWAAGATLLPVLGYGMLAGMSPSTQRAAIMVAVFLFSLMLGRSRDTLNTLAVAALVILIVSPPALFSISFQLSFAAVLTIVAGMQRIGVDWSADHGLIRKVAKRLLAGALVSVLAILGTTPVVLYYFNQTSLVGVAANLVLIPLIGFAAVPAGLISAVTALPLAPVATVGFKISLLIIHAALTVVDGFAALPFAAFYTITPTLPEIVLYYLAAWALFSLRRTPLARWILALVVIAAAGDGLYWANARLWHRDFRVTAMDVGQGTAALLEFPGGGVMLMDGGGFADNRIFDMGQRVIAPLLWRKRIATVDVLALSHPNADHLNGLVFIARHFHVRELWTNGDVNTTWGYEALMAVCREQGIVVRTLDARTADRTIGGVSLSVLHPPPGYATGENADNQDWRNNASLVVRAGFGHTAFLFTGDIMAGAEQTLVEREGGRLASTVLFAPHHGSRTSSSKELIEAVQPEMVVVSAGKRNRFGFPHKAVLDRYKQAGSRLFCTCEHGAIVLASDGRRVAYRQ